MMEHKCRALEGRRLSIDYDYGERGWYMRGGAIKNDCGCIVFHCPYCGLELEKPEPPKPAKIEVSRKVLKNLLDKATTIVSLCSLNIDDIADDVMVTLRDLLDD